MISFRMRPRFDRHVSCRPAQAQRRLKRYVEQSDAGYYGAFYTNHAVLNVPDDEEHFWSPQLSLDLESQPDGGTRIRGVYGPRPSVWTMFMAMYAFALFGGLIGVTFGVSQMSIGMSATGFLAAPVAVALAMFTYGLALVGQYLSRDQIRDLRAFVDEALNACTP